MVGRLLRGRLGPVSAEGFGCGPLLDLGQLAGAGVGQLLGLLQFNGQPRFAGGAVERFGPDRLEVGGKLVELNASLSRSRLGLRTLGP